MAQKTLVKGDICKMLVDFQFDYRKVAWTDVTVLVVHVDGDWITVQHDNDQFTCPSECLEKYGSCNPDGEVE